MKKIFAVLALVGVMTSCKDKKKEEVKVEPTTTTPTTTEPTTTTTEPTTTTPTTGGVPSFKDADVQAYAQAYADYVDAYKKAAESKDMAKFSELGKMGQDLGAKTTAMTQKLQSNPEEAKKLSDFLMAKAAEISEYSKKLMGQ